jgi:hypothetical protein
LSIHRNYPEIILYRKAFLKALQTQGRGYVGHSKSVEDTKIQEHFFQAPWTGCGVPQHSEGNAESINE